MDYLRDTDEVTILYCAFDWRDMYECIKYPRPNLVTKPELKAMTKLKVNRHVENYYGEFYECSIPDGQDKPEYTYHSYTIPCDICWTGVDARLLGSKNG